MSQRQTGFCLQQASDVCWHTVMLGGGGGGCRCCLTDGSGSQSGRSCSRVRLFCTQRKQICKECLSAAPRCSSSLTACVMFTLWASGSGQRKWTCRTGSPPQLHDWTTCCEQAARGTSSGCLCICEQTLMPPCVQKAEWQRACWEKMCWTGYQGSYLQKLKLHNVPRNSSVHTSIPSHPEDVRQNTQLYKIFLTKALTQIYTYGAKV